MKQIGFMLLSLALLVTQKSFAQTAEGLFQKGVQLEEVKGELEKAINVYKSVIDKNSANKPVAAKALLHLGQCYEKLGNSEARKAYERIVREFADQSQAVAEAKARLLALGNVSNGPQKPTPTIRQISGVPTGAEISSDGRSATYIDWAPDVIVVRNLGTGEERRILFCMHNRQKTN